MKDTSVKGKVFLCCIKFGSKGIVDQDMASGNDCPGAAAERILGNRQRMVDSSGEAA